MAFQQGDLDRLDTAIASGVQQVTYADGRTVRYQNLDQMLAARGVIAGEVAAPVNAASRQRRRVIVARVGRL